MLQRTRTSSDRPVVSEAGIAAMRSCIRFDESKTHMSYGRRCFRMVENSLRVILPDPTWDELYRLGLADYIGVRISWFTGKEYAFFSLTDKGICFLAHHLNTFIVKAAYTAL